MKYNTIRKQPNLQQYGVSHKLLLLITVTVAVVAWMVKFMQNPINNIFPFIHNDNQLLQYVANCSLSALALLILAALVQYANGIVNIMPRKNNSTLLLMVLFCSTNPHFFPLSIDSLAAFTTIAVAYQLLHKEQLAPPNACAAAIFIATATLLVWSPTLYLVIPLCHGLYILGFLNRQTIIATFAGVLSVAWVALAVCVWIQDYSIFVTTWQQLGNIAIVHIGSLSDTLNYTNQIGALLITLALELYLWNKKSYLGVKARKQIVLMLTTARYLLAGMCLFTNDSTTFLLLFHITVTLLVAYGLQQAHSKHAAWILYILTGLLLTGFAINYKELWSNIV